MKSFFFLLGLVIGSVLTMGAFYSYWHPDSPVIFVPIFIGIGTAIGFVALTLEEHF